MEIFFSIIAGIVSINAVVFGIRNRINGTKSRTRGGIRDDRSRYNDLVSNCDRLDRDKERVEELDKRDDDDIERCKDISSRIRKREPETTTSE